MKINGKLCYLWRAVDHEGEVLEAVVTARRDKAAALKLLKRIMKKYGPTTEDRHRRALLLFRGDERNWRRRSARGRWPPQQSGGEFAPAVSKARTGYAAVSKCENAAEVQLSSRPGPQPFQSGAASRRQADLHTETLGRIGGVARPCGVDRRLQEGVSRKSRRTAVTLTTPQISLRPRWPSVRSTSRHDFLRHRIALHFRSLSRQVTAEAHRGRLWVSTRAPRLLPYRTTALDASVGRNSRLPRRRKGKRGLGPGSRPPQSSPRIPHPAPISLWILTFSSIWAGTAYP